MFESMLFARDKKASFCYVVILLPLLGAGHPLWMVCGGWLCVFFHTPHFGEAQRRTVCEILTLTGTMQFLPLYLPSCSCDWPYYLKSTYVTDSIVLIT
jgi:hypothetical protein